MALFCSALSRKIELNFSSVSDATYISFETVARRNREQGMRAWWLRSDTLSTPIGV